MDYLDFSIKETRKIREVGVERSVYSRHLRGITQSSGKCMWLFDFLVRLLDEEEERVRRGEKEKKERKVLILTASDPVALILKLVCAFPQLFFSLHPFYFIFYFEGRTY